MSVSGERLHALDAVRGGALLLGVFFHATMSFMEPRIWVVGDSATSEPLTATFFVLHIFRMTVFFVIAGFFARMLLERRGLGGFVADRARRIALPFAVFWPLVLTCIIAVLIWSAAHANGGTLPADAPPPPPLTWQTLPLTHLWFLYALILLYAAALVLRGLFKLIDRNDAAGRGLDAFVRFLVSSPAGAVMLGLPLFIVLMMKSDWMMWFGVPTPDVGLVPNLAAITAFGTAFGFGWLLNRQIDAMRAWEKSWALNLALAIALTAFCLWRGGATPEFTPAPMGWEKVSFAIAYVLAIWTWTFGLIGAALRFLSKPNSAIRYVSDASYWVYIMHIPAVMVGQMLVIDLPLAAEAKYALIVAGTLALGFASYQLLVRGSFIGAMLNGKKPGKRTHGAPVLAAAE